MELLLRIATILAVFMLQISVVFSQPITSIDVSVTTHDDWLSGTDNGVFLWLEVEGLGRIERKLDTPDHNDFETGNTDRFTVSGFNIPDHCKIERIGIHKSPDNWNGGWKLAAVTLTSGGNTIHSESGINQWLEDDDRTWWATYVPPNCPPPVQPPPPNCTAAITVCRELLPGEKDIALDSDCDGIPDMCDNNLGIPLDTDGDGIPDANEDYDGSGTMNDCESDPAIEDSDGDGILDGDEDQDGDGLPDWYEDVNRNCQVDPGESDPNNPDTNGDGTPDGEEDEDDDGIVDWLEDNYGTSATNPDTDGDGWYDGPRNQRTILRLVRIDTERTQENGAADIVDYFSDELFVAFNHARWPEDDDLDGYWRVRTSSPELLQAVGVNASPTYMDVVAAVRVWSPAQITNPTFTVRMDVREDDWFDWTDDDFMLDHDVPFTQENQILTVNVEEENIYHHILTFTVISRWFADPNPTNAAIDADADGIGEAYEFRMAQLLNGVADLQTKDIYMELDWQEGQRPERFSMEDITSRFAYHGYAFHLDEGTWGGGGGVTPIGDVDDDVSLSGTIPRLKGEDGYRSQYFNETERGQTFRYALAVEAVLENRGGADRLIKNQAREPICGQRRGNNLIFEDSDFMNYISDFESIIWIHEFGHNLGLCHLPGDPEATVTGPGGEGGCACCPLDSNQCNCVHYSIGRWNDTAMGAGFTFPWVDDAYQAIDREIDYAEVEWRVIDLRPMTILPTRVDCP